MIPPLGKQQTPEAVYEAAEQFVWAFKNMNWEYAKIACQRLQRTIEAVYWPTEQPSEPQPSSPSGDGRREG